MTDTPRVLSSRWEARQPEWTYGWWVVVKEGSPEDVADSIDESGDGGFDEETARFIADAVNFYQAHRGTRGLVFIEDDGTIRQPTTGDV